MQNRQSQGAWEGEQAQMLLALCAAVLLCWMFFDIFVYWTTWTLYWLWKMVDFPFIHVWAGGKINLLADVANHAKAVTLDEGFSLHPCLGRWQDQPAGRRGQPRQGRDAG
ncbi:hypothetical protein [Pseudomonas syringae]|uniref:hypothetical protein n=1 Tax=Pseudomonas syringae TaxID=317 RepID=UPI002100210B|nr:hypothetical protein [Pseudomonas syringae]